MIFSKEVYELNKIKKDSFIVYTHQGLGDHIICNGLINYLTKKNVHIYMPVKSRDFKNISYLYSQNKYITLFEIQSDKEADDVKAYSKINKLQTLKVGFKKNKPPFNLSFYKQLQIPYEISFENFFIPRDYQKEIELFNYLKNYHKVVDDYQLVHNQSSYGKADLKINPNLNSIYVDKNTDIFKNIFFYVKLIEDAKEIHCLDSSFLHLVERINTSANLYFHNLKSNEDKAAKIYLVKEWNQINY